MKVLNLPHMAAVPYICLLIESVGLTLASGILCQLWVKFTKPDTTGDITEVQSSEGDVVDWIQRFVKSQIKA